MRVVVYAVALLLLAPGCVQGTIASDFSGDDATRLVQMAKDDQAAFQSRDAETFREIARKNSLWLRETVENRGWPTADRVGMEASQAAWLIAQHADHDRGLQRIALESLRRSPQDSQTLRQIAYLEDRLLVAEGKPQMFGTQGRCLNSGRWEPNPIQDDATVDSRRSEHKLEPLGQYVATASKFLCRR